jgi:hypothetical protein
MGVRSSVGPAWAWMPRYANYLEPRPKYIKHMRMIPYIIAAFSVASEFQGREGEALDGGPGTQRAGFVDPGQQHSALRRVFSRLRATLIWTTACWISSSSRGWGGLMRCATSSTFFRGRYLRDPASFRC